MIDYVICDDCHAKVYCTAITDHGNLCVTCCEEHGLEEEADTLIDCENELMYELGIKG